MKSVLAVLLVVFFAQISFAGELKVVIAPNLDKVIKPINAEFEKQNKSTKVVAIPLVSGAAYQQITNGYPVDIFMSADAKYPQELVKRGFALNDDYYVYAIGKLVIWTNSNIKLNNDCIESSLSKDVLHIAIANPKLAPYGRASIEALKTAHIYDKVEKNIVFANDVQQAQQFAQTGNAQIAFIPLALVIKSNSGHYCDIDQNLYKPIKQAMVILKSSKDQALAKKYLEFMKSSQAKKIFREFGYDTP
ncbi:Molybdenum ABC transporter, periplasmic molybdenum-binding protein ModA [Desulfurella amilsii]|uniref:Molybdenum ABC transporter, periplasmic molybdenum-binding protein ModA n=1 Tax=Desulfurella amilsii TaxID=1562698 RepID=A0A1X4XXA6_9BACT|nr:molybdate ABC transporter substrate-binding protein [Desulfurella amilsii]OSS42163.1 Molybdenum ABC transporter, periplasmic molybdenum-binding protein ModA [Desulfurella amilsii]